MIFDFISSLIWDFFDLFPNSPFGHINDFLHSYFFEQLWGHLNYFIPWDWIKTCFDGWATAIITYVFVQQFLVKK